MNTTHALRAPIEQPGADVHPAREASTVALEGDEMPRKVTPLRRSDRKAAPPRTARDAAAAWLVAPQLTARLRRFLGAKGIPDGQADELIDVARMQICERGLPRRPIEVERLLFRIVKCRAADWFREVELDAEGLEGLEEGYVITSKGACARKEPAHASLQTRKELAHLKRLSKGDPKHACAFEAMRQKMAGKSFARFAAERGVRPGTLRQWVRRFRAHVLAQLTLEASRVRHYRV
jgi:hypothetical protein